METYHLILTLRASMPQSWGVEQISLLGENIDCTIKKKFGKPCGHDFGAHASHDMM